MSLSTDDVSWRWVAPDGKQHSGVKWDLVALLSNGTLPPRTLVWRTGWSEWVQASRIAELSDALPAASVEPAVMPPASGQAAPPPLPARASLVDSEWGSVPPEAPKNASPAQPEKSAPTAAAAERAAAPATGGLKLPRAQISPPKMVLPSERRAQQGEPEQPPPSSFGLLGAQKARAPVAVVPTRPAALFGPERGTATYTGNRPPMPTLSDEAPTTATLRPPAAVPPPARGAAPTGPVLDPRAIQRFARGQSAEDTPLPVPGSQARAQATNSEIDVPVTFDDSAPTRRREVLPPPQAQPPPLQAAPRAPLQAPAIRILGEPRPPAPTLPDASVGVLGEARPIQPTIPDGFPGPAQPAPSELAPAIVHAPVVPQAPPMARPAPVQPPPPAPIAHAPQPPVQPAPANAPAWAGSPPASTDAPLDSTLGSQQHPAPLPPAAHAALASLPQQPPAPQVQPAYHSNARAATAPSPVKRLQLAVYVLAGMASLLGLLAIGLLIGRKQDAARAVEQTAPSASASASAAPLKSGCEVLAHPARLGANIERSVTPLLVPFGNEGRAALGFAETPKKAVGLVISIAGLDAGQSFQKTYAQPLRSVVPLVNAGRAEFDANTDSDALKNPRTVDAKPPFLLAVGANTLVRIAGSSPPAPIWPIPPASAVTELRVASTARGHLVTFRVGALDGRVMIGWLNPDGSTLTELTSLETPKFVGTPFAAADGERFVLAFAARSDSAEPWHIELATGEAGSTTVTSRSSFQQPPGGLGGALAPSIAPLPNGSWLLQWTEGKTGMYQVRTQMLDGKLAGVGDAVVVSPKGASSGQGAVFTSGARAVSLYIQTIGGHDELWGTTLECR